MNAEAMKFHALLDVAAARGDISVPLDRLELARLVTVALGLPMDDILGFLDRTRREAFLEEALVDWGIAFVRPEEFAAIAPGSRFAGGVACVRVQEDGRYSIFVLVVAERIPDEEETS